MVTDCYNLNLKCYKFWNPVTFRNIECNLCKMYEMHAQRSNMNIRRLFIPMPSANMLSLETNVDSDFEDSGQYY